jgi:adenylate cyclase
LEEEDLANPERSGFDPSRPSMMRVAVRDGFSGRFRPSRRMVSKALQEGSSVMHIWSEDEEDDGQFTMTGSLDWAFCIPITSESCRGWCLYVSGEGGGLNGGVVSEDALKGDLRFTELVSQFIGSIRQVRLLEEHKTQLSSFFSPTVMESLTGKDAQAALQPSEREVSVLFCDVRGFSLKSEKLQDQLLQLLQSVKAALGVMANSIVEHDGAIADFQGDAALGFWGWPVASVGPIPACRAALKINQEFNSPSEPNELLEGFSVGIGVAHGNAIAGEIGTENQMKIGVFGPVVNQGARFESMTKQFGVTICIDEITAKYVRHEMPTSEARVRTLARVRPKGMGTAITVSELIPPASESDILDETIAGFEKAIEHVTAGDWDTAIEIFKSLPEADAPAQALIAKLADYGNKPPADWDGAFSLTKK